VKQTVRDKLKEDLFPGIKKLAISKGEESDY
jgi:hypothetical protein